ncbi:SRPBCC family protein [Streptomyces sp. SS1-1]|uniref:SRPBCC family protein n=1 Tax=Streptomyces sp. SS1-1 TaxID=2651869 RepID=UPI0012501A02|nr:SRPBCC family protein [Streptomyces sp. SS1-1]KAB2976714.1 SRPBCC family protein [Streptomyces sp. SS1-1]
MTTPTSTTATLDLPVPGDTVWQLIGGFGALPDWLPYIPVSELEEGGRVRVLTNEEGGVIVERLQRFDDDARTYTYSIVDAPFPVTGYRSTLTVHDTDGTGSRVEWSGTFTPAGVSEEEAVALFQGIYRDGLAALKQTLGA